MLKIIKKNDILALVSILAFCLVFLLIFNRFVHKSGKSVVIKQNNAVFCRESLYRSKEIKLSHNTVIIENGKVYMKEADCKNQICVKHKKISEKGEVIICLPNRVSVEIK